MSLPAWGAWIEIKYELRKMGVKMKSLPAWGAWIEIRQSQMRRNPGRLVAPRMGSVD